MLNGREYNGILICVAPKGVEAPNYDGLNLKDHKGHSHRKNAPKVREEVELDLVDELDECLDEVSEETEEVVEFEEIIEFEDFDEEWYEKEYPKDVFVEKTIRCANGTMTIKCSEYQFNEIHTWFYDLGAFVDYSDDTFNAIELDESGIFHIFGDDNDGNYRYFRGDFMHKIPARCFGLVEVEPLEDGGQVWRDFSDFDEVEVTFNLY
jgi:hypothetical protein